MIQPTLEHTWAESLRQCISDPLELLQQLNLTPLQVGLPDALTDFPLRVPREFVARMRSGDPHDPLLLQVLPRQQELLQVPGFSSDPLGEQQANPIPGLLHKYYGRVLLTLAGACPVNCRYCFRRHFPYQENVQGAKDWSQALRYINGNHSVAEVILSGGEPLLVKDAALTSLCDQLAEIEHVTTLRIHTRMPIMIPSRVNQALLALLKRLPLNKVVVLHCNHAREIDAAVIAAITALRDVGVTVLNQAVLLRRVNDNVNALQQLSEQLFAAGVLPYYLHLLDKVQGAAHFEVPEVEAIELVQQLQRRVPGYLVPKLAREVAGEGSKVVVY